MMKQAAVLCSLLYDSVYSVGMFSLSLQVFREDRSGMLRVSF